MDFMHREQIGEKPLNVRLRAQRIKDRLRHYRQNYKRIVIVSHFFTIRYICSQEFKNDEPVEGLVMKNCGVHSVSLEEISKYS
jgi:broad specificity phosphatase PhoE